MEWSFGPFHPDPSRTLIPPGCDPVWYHAPNNKAEMKLAIRRCCRRPTSYPDPIHRHPTGHPVPMCSSGRPQARKDQEKKTNKKQTRIRGGLEPGTARAARCRYRPRGHINHLFAAPSTTCCVFQPIYSTSSTVTTRNRSIFLKSGCSKNR